MEYTEERDENARVEVAIHDVHAELFAAMRKHGALHSAHEGYAVIMEELDELKDEVWKRDKDLARMRAEAKQVAAMAIRFMVDVCRVREEN